MLTNVPDFRHAAAEMQSCLSNASCARNTWRQACGAVSHASPQWQSKWHLRGAARRGWRPACRERVRWEVRSLATRRGTSRARSLQPGDALAPWAFDLLHAPAPRAHQRALHACEGPWPRVALHDRTSEARHDELRKLVLSDSVNVAPLRRKVL